MSDPKPAIFPVPKSRAEAEKLLAEMADDYSKLRKREAAMTKAVTDARTDHEHGIKILMGLLDARRAALASWAEKSKETDFVEPRSIETVHGIVGFKKSPPSLQLLAKMTWPLVVKRLVGNLKKYVRIKIEVNRALLLSDATAEKPLITPAKLSKVGVRVDGADEFFVTLKEN